MAALVTSEDPVELSRNETRPGPGKVERTFKYLQVPYFPLSHVKVLHPNVTVLGY